MSNLEIIAALLGIVNIVLIVRRSIWNYPFALASVAFYFFIFRDIKLYSDAGLQIFFFVVNLYGWWNWFQNKQQAGEVVVERLSGLGLGGWLFASVSVTAAWGAIMAAYTDASHPYWDAAVAMLSVAGQILMARRYLENWWWWIVVNTISIPLYWIKELPWTVGLFCINFVLAIVGLIEWRKVRARQA